MLVHEGAVDLDDIRMLQGGEDCSLLLEAHRHVCSGIGPGKHELGGNTPTGFSIYRLKDAAHPPGPDLADQAIVAAEGADELDDEERHSLCPAVDKRRELIG